MKKREEIEKLIKYLKVSDKPTKRKKSQSNKMKRDKKVSNNFEKQNFGHK